MKYLVMEQVRIENPLIDIALFVEKTKKVMHIGVTRPPPPIPAMVDRAIKTESTIKPPNSMGYTGNTSL